MKALCLLLLLTVGTAIAGPVPAAPADFSVL